MAFVTSQRQGSLAELKCNSTICSFPHITPKPLSKYTEEEKLTSLNSVKLRNITLTFFFGFIAAAFLRRHKIMKVFYVLNLKVFPKYFVADKIEEWA